MSCKGLKVGMIDDIYWATGKIVRDDYNVIHERVLVLKPNKWLLVLDDQ